MSDFKLHINELYKINNEQIRFFRENGFVKLKNVLSEEAVNYYGKIISQKVVELNQIHLPMEERTTYQKAFLQIFNLWRENETINEFVKSKRLAKIAADLLGVEGVRLYHDQALYKEPSGGITPWHADQFYWPLDSDKTITIWIPLQKIPLSMGPLAFSVKSHKFSFGRDLEISDESEAELKKALEKENISHFVEPFDIGEVSLHYGWTFHHAGANNSDKVRAVMTIIYMDENIKLKEPTNDYQRADWEKWCPGVKIGNIVASPLNPILYRQRDKN